MGTEPLSPGFGISLDPTRVTATVASPWSGRIDRDHLLADEDGNQVRLAAVDDAGRVGVDADPATSRFPIGPWTHDRTAELAEQIREDVLETIVRSERERAGDQLGIDLKYGCIAVPAPCLDARDRIAAACRRAGFEDVILISRAQATGAIELFRSLTDNAVVVLDLGEDAVLSVCTASGLVEQVNLGRCRSTMFRGLYNCLNLPSMATMADEGGLHGREYWRFLDRVIDTVAAYGETRIDTTIDTPSGSIAIDETVTRSMIREFTASFWDRVAAEIARVDDEYDLFPAFSNVVGPYARWSSIGPSSVFYLEGGITAPRDYMQPSRARIARGAASQSYQGFGAMHTTPTDPIGVELGIAGAYGITLPLIEAEASLPAEGSLTVSSELLGHWAMPGDGREIRVTVGPTSEVALAEELTRFSLDEFIEHQYPGQPPIPVGITAELDTQGTLELTVVSRFLPALAADRQRNVVPTQPETVFAAHAGAQTGADHDRRGADTALAGLRAVTRLSCWDAGQSEFDLDQSARRYQRWIEWLLGRDPRWAGPLIGICLDRLADLMPIEDAQAAIETLRQNPRAQLPETNGY